MPIAGTVSREQRGQLAAELRKHGVPNPDKLAQLAAASAKIVAKQAAEPLPIGASRFGGAPDVPPGFRWPTRAGRPLSFLAQIDLEELRHPELPSGGWIAFFYDWTEQPWGFDPKDSGGASVVYFTGDRSSLQSLLQPQGAGDDGVFRPCRLSFADAVDLPHEWDSIVLAETGSELAQRYWDDYSAVVHQAAGTHDDSQYHHLLGHPQLVQDDMRRECQLVTNGIYCGDPSGYESEAAKALFDRAQDWRLLMQLDTDEDGPGWMWGDCGRLYFWIKKGDLAARAFDRTWTILQCG